MTNSNQQSEFCGGAMQCANCGSPNTTSRRDIDEFEYGVGDQHVTLRAVVNVHTCHECGFEFTDSSAEDARHEVICKHLGVMTPAELKGLRKRYGLSRGQMASITRIGESSLGRWESGALIQTGAYDNYLFLLSFKENFERIQQRQYDRTTTVQHRDASDQSEEEDKWRSITVTNSIREEQAVFHLHPSLN